MSVIDALQKFQKSHEQTLQALHLLKSAVKDEGSKTIQEHIRTESFDNATKVIDELNRVTKIEFNSNVDEVSDYIQSIFGEIQINEKKGQSAPYARDEEEEQMPAKASSSFKAAPAKAPFIDKSSFLSEVEGSLKKRGFEVLQISEERIEISENNAFYHLTPDFGTYEDAEYFRVMDETSALKSVGFVCADAEILKRAKKAVMKWVESNKAKCKFLSVHFANLESIDRAPKVFETISF